jgi:hypothetical protein
LCCLVLLERSRVEVACIAGRRKNAPLAPNKPLGQGRQQGGRLGLDPAALPARQVAGAWANHWGKCSPLRCTTADPELQQDNRVKKPG